MRRILLYLLTAIIVTSCGDDERFRISGTIEGNPTMNLRVNYYASGVNNSLITASREGKFEFYGSSQYGSVVEIYDYDNKLLGRAYIANGEVIELKLNRENPFLIEASGNEATSAWARFLRSNAEVLQNGGTDADRAIADYIADHPDRLESTLILVGNFNAARNPQLADSLMELIDPAVRPSNITESFNYLLQRMVLASVSEPVMPFRYLERNDSVRTFKPSDSHLSLLVIDNNKSKRADSIVPVLKRLSRLNRPKTKILELSTDPDTIEWKRTTRRDTATWTQAWVAGGIAGRGINMLGIPSVPYCIVVDSAGTQLHRGISVAEAEAFIRNYGNN